MAKDLRPPLLREGGMEERKKSKTNRHKPKRHEQRVAAAVGGSRQPGSGAFEGAKGDVRRDHIGFPLLVECKRTSGQKSLRVEAAWLDKISREASGQNKYPALSIEFDEAEVVAAEATWVAVPLTVFRAMLEALGEKGIEL